MPNDEIVIFLKKHLQSIQDNDTQTYSETTAEDLTLYEWWITPHRIDGLPFHEFMMTANAERGTVFGAEGRAKSPTRFDLSNLHIQNYGDTALLKGLSIGIAYGMIWTLIREAGSGAKLVDGMSC